VNVSCTIVVGAFTSAVELSDCGPDAFHEAVEQCRRNVTELVGVAACAEAAGTVADAEA
jgi:hypothetical protein